jgi:ribose/xylose/arabinose/galactoside ABC-type transport system permease subunit
MGQIQAEMHNLRSRNLLAKFGDFASKNAMVLVLFAFLIFSTIVSKGIFLRPSNIITILFQTSIVGVISLGQMLVIISGGLDLSVASVAILVAVLMGGTSSLRQQALSFSGFLPFLGLVPAIILGLSAGLIMGLINGLIIAFIGVPPFITTLATMLMASGVAMILTGGAPIYYPAEFFTQFAATTFFGIPAPVYLWFILLAIIGYILHRTKLGAKTYAIGGNERAAIYSGINVKAVKIVLYMLCGLLAAVGGFLFLSRIGSVTLDSGRNLLMQSIAMVVVGGVLLQGGKGGIKEALVGSLILASLSNLMNIMLVNQYIQSAVEGLVILVAVMVNTRFNRDR